MALLEASREATRDTLAMAWKEQAQRASSQLQQSERQAAELEKKCAELSSRLLARENEQAAVALQTAHLDCKMGLLNNVRKEQARQLVEQKARLKQLEHERAKTAEFEISRERMPTDAAGPSAYEQSSPPTTPRRNTFPMPGSNSAARAAERAEFRARRAEGIVEREGNN